jgi:predicted component of type VI protein secretion system
MSELVTLESTIDIPPDVLFREVEGEAVLLNTTTGKYFGLDQVGTRMWTLLAQHGRVEPAYQALVEEYDVAPEQLRKDLLDLVGKLVAHGLVQVEG